MNQCLPFKENEAKVMTKMGKSVSRIRKKKAQAWADACTRCANLYIATPCLHTHMGYTGL